MKTLFQRLKQFSFLRWTYILLLAFIFITCFSVFPEGENIFTLLFIVLLECLAFLALPLLIGGIIDVITNSKIPAKKTLIVLNIIIILSFSAFYTDVNFHRYSGTRQYDGNYALLYDLPKNEEMGVKKVLQELDSRLGKDKYEVLVSLIKLDSSKNNLRDRAFYLYQLYYKSKSNELTESSYYINNDSLLQTEKKPIQVTPQFIKGLDERIAHSNHYYLKYDERFKEMYSQKVRQRMNNVPL